MKIVFVCSLLLSIGLLPCIAFADIKGRLIGLKEDEILFCAGIPAAHMKSGQTTIFQYAESKQIGGIAGTGDIGVFSTISKGCQAQILLQKGTVIDVKLKTRGLISGPLACERIFSACE